MPAPTFRFALSVTDRRFVDAFAPYLERAVAERPAMLISYVWLKRVMAVRHKFGMRDWVLDSGAFSVINSGGRLSISLTDYIRDCQALLKIDPQLTEIFSLDVIDDHVQSLKNCEQMWAAGIEAIPCYHVGEPEHALLAMARDYPKVALGGVAALRGSGKLRFVEECFARIWPKKIHGFGVSGEKEFLAVPWHSVDASTWGTGPMGFGRYRALKNLQLSLSSQQTDLRMEIEYFLRLEKQAQGKWHKVLQELPA